MTTLLTSRSSRAQRESVFNTNHVIGLSGKFDGARLFGGPADAAGQCHDPLTRIDIDAQAADIWIRKQLGLDLGRDSGVTDRLGARSSQRGLSEPPSRRRRPRFCSWANDDLIHHIRDALCITGDLEGLRLFVVALYCACQSDD